MCVSECECVYVRGCDKSTSKIQHCAGETQKQTKTQTRKIVILNGLSCQNISGAKWIEEGVETVHKQEETNQTQVGRNIRDYNRKHDKKQQQQVTK